MARFARTLVLLCGILLSAGVGAGLCVGLAHKNRPSRTTIYADDHVGTELVNGVYVPNYNALIEKRDREQQQVEAQAATIGGIGGGVLGAFVFRGLGILLIRSDRPSKS